MQMALLLRPSPPCLRLAPAAAVPRTSTPVLPPLSTHHHRPSRDLPTSFPRCLLSTPAKKKRGCVVALASSPRTPSAPLVDGDSEKAKLAQVAKRLESTARHFKRLGSLGFWGQLVSTSVAAVILSFSAVVTGKITSPATFYATAGGIAAAFISVFWSFGYIRLSERLRRTANDPSKAPPRAEVVKSLKNGIIVNLLGMGAAVLGMQATVGLLVAKALTTSAIPYYQGISPGQSPVLALDVFLVQLLFNLDGGKVVVDLRQLVGPKIRCGGDWASTMSETTDWVWC